MPISFALNVKSNADHSANDENAGMDLYNTLHARKVSYAELDAAALEEYVYLGRRVVNIEELDQPDGVPLFQPRRV